MDITEIKMATSEVRSLYRDACHGAGAAERRIARRVLETAAEREGLRLGQFFAEYGLDLPAYFASRPFG